LDCTKKPLWIAEGNSVARGQSWMGSNSSSGLKYIEDYNHAIHKDYTKLWFCEKEPSEEDKFEKTLQTMLPSDRVLQHQYRVRNYQYVVLIRDLQQAGKHDELNIKNHHQHRVGPTTLPEIHHNEKKPNFSKDNNMKKNDKSARRHRNKHKNR
jgi:hypothetical protein